ncbi:hypothetical protein ACWPKO_05795 [Coraliomargarita sp. W4R53]
MKLRNRRSNKQAQGGFALVIALTLMAFVLVLLVSMTLLVNVETASSQAVLNQLRAKESARLALMMALGDLQRYAGPDQRVTARADILGSSVPTSNQMWTGVWDTSAPAAAPFWLVSNAEEIDVKTTPLAAHTIQEGYDPDGNGSYDETNAYPATQISLLEINSNGDEIGWWISDEGVKAPVQIVTGHEEEYEDLPDEDLYLDYDGESERVLSALHDPVFDFTDLIDITEADSELIQRLQRAPSTDSIRILTDSFDSTAREKIDAELNNSATLTNAFVLSDPVNGGLKKDLSYLKVLPSDSTSQSDLNTLFADEDNLITPAAVELLNFRGNPSAFPAEEIIGMQLPYATIDEAQNETAHLTIAPVITEFQFIAGVAADGQGASLDTSTDSSLYVVYKAYLELWNPYTIPMRIGDPTLASDLGYSDLKVVIRNLPDFTISNSDTGLATVSGSLGEISLLWSDSPSAKTLRPGMVFSQTLPLDSLNSNKGAIVEALTTTPATIAGTRRETYSGDFVFTGPLQIVILGIDSHSNEHEIFTSEITYPDFQIDYDGDNSATRFKRQLSIQAGATGITKDSIEQPGYAFGFRFKMLDEQEYPGTVSDISNWLSKYDVLSRKIEINLDDWNIDDAWDESNPFPYDFDSSATGYDPSDFDHTEGFKDDDFFTYNSTGGGRQDRIARFVDLPTSEVTDIGIFRSLKFKDYVSNSVGNTWGQDINGFYDRYFFSTLPDPAISNWDGNAPLANARIIKYDDAPELTDPDTANSLILTNGFNLNSTSTLAWQKVLAGKSYGASDFEFKYEKNEDDYTEAPIWSEVTESLSHVFFNNPQTALYNLEERVASPRFSFITRDNTADYIDAFRIDNTTWLTERQYPSFWQSVRELTDTDVQDLAAAITTQIINFGTINQRPLISIQELLTEGILEDAINAVPNINSRQDDNDRIPAYTPAHISTMTLMNAMGSLSFVRSDTFKITAIAHTRNPITGRIVSGMTCEALVQRTPTPHTDTQFGRNFKIIDIQWKPLNQ